MGLDSADAGFEPHLEEGEHGETQRKRKKRVRNWTAEDRARHRVFERSRREAFNERLNELASLLPTLKDAKETTLSKHIIVEESVKHHHAQQDTIGELSRSLEDLKRRHEQLQAEVTAWRQVASLPDAGEGAPSLGDRTAESVHAGASLAARHSFPSGADHAIASTRPSGVAGRQEHATRHLTTELPQTSVYPSSFNSLAPHLPSADSDPALEALDGAVPKPHVSEIMPQLGNLQDWFDASNVSAAAQDGGMQYLLACFQQNPDLAAGAPELGHTQSSAMQHDIPPALQQWGFPDGLQDLRQTDWTSQPAGDWSQSSTSTDRGEMDLYNALHFRNDTSIMNV